MMDWDKLRVFCAVVKAGSFANAQDSPNLCQSAISRQISGLEQHLKVSLFHRHARGLKLTEQGELLHGAVEGVLAQVSMAEALVTEHRDCPRGPLKISTTAGFGAFWLAPRLKEFHALYPEIKVTLTLDGGGADLAMREADVAIRLSAPQQANLVQRRLLTTRSHAFATPEYLREHGTPLRAEDLDHHRLIVQARDGWKCAADDRWLLELGAAPHAPRQPIAAVDELYGLYRAVSSGLGIGALPTYIAPDTAGLVQVLPDLASPKVEGYFVYPAELRHSKRIAVFRDFLVRKIAEVRLQLDPSAKTEGAINVEPFHPVPIAAASAVAPPPIAASNFLSAANSTGVNLQVRAASRR